MVFLSLPPVLVLKLQLYAHSHTQLFTLVLVLKRVQPWLLHRKPLHSPFPSKAESPVSQTGLELAVSLKIFLPKLLSAGITSVCHLARFI